MNEMRNLYEQPLTLFQNGADRKELQPFGKDPIETQQRIAVQRIRKARALLVENAVDLFCNAFGRNGLRFDRIGYA